MKLFLVFFLFFVSFTSTVFASFKIQERVDFFEKLNVIKISTEKKTKSEKISLGEKIYKSKCVPCHQISGEGIAHVFPPLASSDFLRNQKTKAINAVSNGLDGPIKVNGQMFDGQMPSLDLTNEEVASVLTFVYNSWGNDGDEITVEEVKNVRNGKK